MTTILPSVFRLTPLPADLTRAVVQKMISEVQTAIDTNKLDHRYLCCLYSTVVSGFENGPATKAMHHFLKAQDIGVSGTGFNWLSVLPHWFEQIVRKPVQYYPEVPFRALDNQDSSDRFIYANMRRLVFLKYLLDNTKWSDTSSNNSE